MIKIGSRTGHKLGILLILTTLAIGSAACLNWESPGASTSYIPGDYNLNVKGDSDNSSNTVDFYYDQGNGWQRFAEGVSNSGSSSSPYWEVGIDSNLGSISDLDLKANFSSGEDFGDTTTVTLDKGGPDSFTLVNPSNPTNQENPEVEVEVTDSYSDVENISMSVIDSDSNEVDSNNCDTSSSTSTCSVDINSDLDNGETYEVEIEAYDSVDNYNTPGSTPTFTVDTEYDGDDNPSFSVEDESDGVVMFDDDKDLTVDFGDADSTSDTTVTCYVADEEVDSFTVSSGDDNPDESDTTCKIDEDDNEDYYDSSAEIYLKMEDEAGNTAESDTETVSFDVNPPSVTGLEIPTDADLYNSNFDVEFSAFDSASEVEEVEYYFESSTSFGDGTEFDSVDQDSYEIDTSDLEAGDLTLYVRARDEADRWSSPDTVDFSFDPEAVPETSLDVPENISVTAGQEGSFDATIENTGDLHISTIDLSASSEGVFSSSQSISDLEPGESVTVTLDIETESGNIGEHKIEVSTDNPSMSEEIGLLVEANSDQQSRIDSDISEYQSSLQELEANVTELRQKVSQEKRDRLDSNFTAFKDKVENAQAAVDRGDYYEAESILEGVDQDRTTAQDSYNAVQKEYQNNQFWMFIFLGVGGFLVLGGGALAAISYSDEVDFDVRDYLEKLQQKDFDSNRFEEYIDKFKKMLEGKDTSDAEDFKWDGFDDN